MGLNTAVSMFISSASTAPFDPFIAWEVVSVSDDDIRDDLVSFMNKIKDKMGYDADVERTTLDSSLTDIYLDLVFPAIGFVPGNAFWATRLIYEETFEDTLNADATFINAMADQIYNEAIHYPEDEQVVQFFLFE